ncbi:MAG: pilus assembly protein TadG-related protein [Marmoricola sp.]
MTIRHRDERGAVAILVGVLSTLLLCMAALTVDLGNAMVVRREIQKRTDGAALAGGYGENLPTSATTSTCGYGPRAAATDQAVIDVAKYFGTQASNSTVTAADLRDCVISNGEVLYGTYANTSANSTNVALTYDKNALTVISPTTRVGFGFAQVMGYKHVDVGASATVQIGQVGLSTLPLYAFNGCDYGGQTIAQPTNGHAAADVLLSHESETNSASVSSLATSPVTSPARIPLNANASSDSLVVNGVGLAPVTKVGFFESGTSSAGPEPVVVPVTAAMLTGATKITIDHLPPSVTGVQTFWYVRVFIAGSVNKWSDVTQGNGSNVVLAAQPLRVGDPTLTCGQGSSEGNFGTLLLPNSAGPNGQSDNIAYNIADGLQHPLDIFPNAASNWLCSASSPGARLWPLDKTNCVDTKTGLDLNAAQKGLIEGVSSKRGLLDNLNPKFGAGTGCAANGAPATRAFGSYVINNDTLSCFFTDNVTNVGMVSGASYTGQPVISADIYKSARFVRVPVLGVQPSSGGSNRYQVVGMRNGFITDQPASASRTSSATSTNGISGASGDVASVQVVFLNQAALPPPPDTGGALGAYQGGAKTMRLVN